MNPKELFLSACRRLPTKRPPVWLMRQAGRYLPEYRDVREKYDFLTICRRPDLIFELSLQPWRRFEMDAVIVFSDILLPLASMGPRLEYIEGKGPSFDEPIRTEKQIKNLSIPHARVSLEYVLEAITNIKHEIKDEAALIGFVGSPWTLAAYLIAQNGERLEEAPKLLRSSPSLVAELMDKISDTIAPYAVEQINAGADAIQIFDTWGGLITPDEWRETALPYIKKVVSKIKGTKKPAILFVKHTSPLLDNMLSSGADVISIGTDITLADAFKKTDGKVAIQGNLNPETLLHSPSIVEKETKDMLSSVKNFSGYIANLGHGVLPKTPVESVKAFVDTVKIFKSDE